MKGAWSNPVQGTKMFQFVKKLKMVKAALKDLNKEGFHDIQAAELKACHDMIAAHKLMHEKS